MREIKFRAWDASTSEMHYPEDRVHDTIKTASANILKHYDTVMQWTGLHDRNGKEIYEGDVLAQSGRTNYRFGDMGVVEYETDYAGFIVKGKYHRNQHYALLSCDVATDCEVIGNVHQNPELV